jgi:glutamate N-acetyltransferase/amino-acid N-acetyltransferase
MPQICTSIHTSLADLRIPGGFRFGSAAAGIKKTDRLDLALAEAPNGAAVAALFTTNLVKAAPLLIDERHLRKARGNMRALIVNSGNANCATGKDGLRSCEQVCAALADVLRAKREQVFPSSTGVIGVPLPAKKIVAAIPQLVLSLDASRNHIENFARAIMTTDTRPKLASTQIQTKRGPISLLGIAKGAGMIHPNMATMLAYIFTDAAAEPRQLHRMVARSAANSFNAISIDGDTSTNDTLALFASGASSVQLKGRVADEFQAALTAVCTSLAEQIVADGEGVQHVIRLQVEEARSENEARQIADTIATSMLVKTAFSGADPNWGRILAAIGRAGISLDPTKISIYFGDQQVCRHGTARDFDEAKARVYLSHSSFDIRITLGRGHARAIMLMSDLTAEYVRINADYRT